MTYRSLVRSIIFCAPLLLACQEANAWFFFLASGLIARAFETDPGKIVVTSKDRLAGKCAGYHTNQMNQPGRSDDERTFHKIMSEKAIEISVDKEKVTDLGGAYSTRWSRAADDDLKSSSAYGADLAAACRSIGLPATLAEQGEAKRQGLARQQQEEAGKQGDAKRNAVEEETKKSVVAQAPASSMIDFNSEARKSARILGCNTSDLKVVGAEEGNMVFLASCDSGVSLTLSCDPTGLCLKK